MGVKLNFNAATGKVLLQEIYIDENESVVEWYAFSSANAVYIKDPATGDSVASVGPLNIGQNGSITLTAEDIGEDEIDIVIRIVDDQDNYRDIWITISVAARVAD